MISRFFKKSGSPKNAVDYLQREEHNPSVLRGNLQNFEALASSLDFKHQYTSGVLRFNENPDDEVLNEIMDEYTDFLTAGLNQPPEVCFVMHEEHGETELHFVLANVDMQSGRLFQPYLHKRDLACRDALDNKINAEFNFTDPDDPVNKRLVNTEADYRRQENKFDVNGFKNRKELAKAIDDLVLKRASEALKNGLTYTQENALEDIKNIGFDVKTSRGKLSITHPDMGKSMRLKGAFYESDFSFSASSIKAIKSDSERYRASSKERYEANASEYSRLFEQRASHVKNKYKHSWQRVAKAVEANKQQFEQTSAERTKANTEYKQNDVAVVVDTNSDNNINDTANTLDRKRSDRESEEALQHTNTDKRTRDSKQDESESLRRRDVHLIARRHKDELQGLQERLPNTVITPCFYHDKKIGEVVDHGDSLRAKDFKSDKAAAFNIVQQSKQKQWKSIEFTGSDEFLKHAFNYALSAKMQITPKDEHQKKLLEEVQNDRARNIANKAIERAEQANRELAKTCSELESSGENINRQSSDFRQKIKRFDNATGERRMRREDELERFKTDINLVDYAQDLGFEVVKKESTAKSVKMKQGSDTLIISTDTDGHGIYFNAQSNKSGSIIDLVQEFKNLNLGQVRKELRPFIGRDASARTEREHYTPKPLKSSKDQMAVANAFAKTEPLLTHPYLTKRGISEHVQSSAKFQAKFRIDEYKNVVFPHFKSGEVVGFEKKNTDFTGFSSNGEKALWYSNDLMKSEKIVVVESAIDAMSFEQLHGNGKSYGYISIGGQPNEQQLQALSKLDASKLVLALDNDEGGESIRRQVEAVTGDLEQIKPVSKDFNQDLQNQQQQQEQEHSLSM